MGDLKIIDLSLIKFDNLVKLSKKGQIHKLYYKMYCVAEKLAIHENKKYLAEIGITHSNMDIIQGFELIAKHRQERIEYHYNEMKKLLKMSLKEQSKNEK